MTHMPQVLTLNSLAARLREAGLLIMTHGWSPAVRPDPAEMRITTDSRDCKRGDVFVALRGTKHDGHAHIQAALAAGAAALVVEADKVRASCPVFQVSSSRKALGQLASLLYGNPSGRLGITAVTGTNGKTTTAWLIAQALESYGLECGFMGTIGYGRPTQMESASHTTPDPLVLQRILADMAEQGVRACAMEASSHAIDQDRTEAIALKAAVFTNLTRDHLDYHGTFEAYRAAKARLFEGLESGALAVINGEDPAAEYMAQRTIAQVVRFGTRPGCDIIFAIRSDQASGLKLRLDGQDAHFQLSGSFNASNLAAAYAALSAYGLSPAERLDALQEARPAPGRFELVRLKRDRVAIVDYAHTPDALQNVLEAARRIVPAGANLWCVFGCGGDRDAGKRPMMGAIAEALADRVVVTSDNPRTEDPETILDDVREGMRKPAEAHWVADRRAAIRRAVQSAGVGDVLVVAGKGHESYQVIGEEKLPFSDLDELKAAAGG